MKCVKWNATARLLALILLGLASQVAMAVSSLVDHAEIVPMSDGTLVTVYFNVPVTIQNYAPPEQGDLLTIRVQTLSAADLEDPGEIGRDEWLGINQSGYGQIYESIRWRTNSVKQGILEITFRNPANYSVLNGPDSRSLVIKTDLLLPESAVAETGEVPPANLLEMPEAVKVETESAKSQEEALMMEEARRALATGEYNRAVGIYTKILQNENSIFAKQALEYLGVAREKKGQMAHAMAIYKQYLEKFPEGEDAIRVNQRVAGLLTQAEEPLESKRVVTAKVVEKEKTNKWLIYGGFSQYYRYFDLAVQEDDPTDVFNPTEKDILLESSLTSNLDLTARLQTDDWDIRTRFSGGYISDLSSNGSGDKKRLSQMYLDAKHKDSGRELRVGRQSDSSGGVLGRFDGAQIGLPVSETVTFNLVAGFPVQRSTDAFVQTGRYFYGTNVDFGPYNGSWEFNTFIVEQRNHHLLDRRSVGGEARYFRANRSLFTLIDYDIEFNDLNTFLLIGNWTNSHKTTFTLTLDRRNSPVLTLQSALAGQGVDNLSQLEEIYTEDEIRQIAQDRTADATLVNFGITHPISEKFQVYGNVSMTEIDGTRASAGVEAFPGTGKEYGYDLQLIGSGLLIDNDTHIFSVRYFDGNTSTRTTLRYDARYPFRNNFRFNPRLRADYRENVLTGLTKWTYRASGRLDYRWHKRLHIEMEIGNEWSTREITVTRKEKTQGLFGTLGARWDF